VGALAFLPAPLIAQQQQHDHPEAAGPSAPEVPLLEAVTGDFSRHIDTDSPLAQAYFDQGLQMVYAFTYPVAIRSFQEAQRQDPNCAMCYWGEAQARGPFLNSRMTESNAGPAYVAAQKALSLIDQTDDPLEKALINAMSIRYAEVHDQEYRAELDSAYSQAMAEVYRAYPNDLDVATLYAESIMLLNTERACADLLMTAVPGASHLNHMPSHTYNVLGRWGKAVRANALAWRSDDLTAYGLGVSYSGTHNLHMLFYAGSMDGQGQVATAAAAEYARQVNGGVFYHSLVLLRFGEFHKILQLTEMPEQPIQQGLWEFARGYAHLRTGHPDSAAVYLARVDQKADTVPDRVQMRNHTAHNLLTITGDLLRGEMLRSEGKLAESIPVFEEAVTIQDGLRYDEPEPLNFSARHWLGDALLEAQRYADAEQVYRAAIEQHPDNGWSYFGLEKALRLQGKTGEADAAKAEFARVWARSDVFITSSRF
jgi:tetratricopeptide (TPR) repeat protein